MKLERGEGEEEEEWEERKGGTLACRVAFVFKIFWRGTNERREERGQGELEGDEEREGKRQDGWGKLLMGF